MSAKNAMETMETTDTLIDFKRFSYTYEGRESPALADITLQVRRGELVLITGESGCGKTSLTRCINGLIPEFYRGTTSGSCTVLGMEIGEREIGEYAPFVGSVFQDPRSQFFTLHVNSELSFQSENLQHERSAIRTMVEAAIDLFELQPLIGKGILQLSSGEKQKIAIASAYAAGVQVFVLDEPSANLDVEGAKQLAGALEKLKRDGKTVIVSEHKLYYLRDLVDRVIYMQHGAVAADMTRSEFLSLSADRVRAYALRPIALEHSAAPAIRAASCEARLALHADDLGFYFDRRAPLWERVSFSAHSGSIVGILGENGAGKSTLIRVLMGLEKQKRGTIRLNGKPSSQKMRRRSAFYVMQDVDYQLFAATVLEEMLLGHEEEENCRDKALELLERFGLSEYAGFHPSELSGGQKQRLSIALAHMSGADVICLDEPTSGLDEKNMLLVCDAILELARSGCCLFVITHDYELAMRTFRSALVLTGAGEARYYPEDEYDTTILRDYFGIGGTSP